jgi:hypothetical protein
LIIQGNVDTYEDIAAIQLLIPEAQRRADEWIAAHGVTSKTITYDIVNRELSNYPELS